ncbi:CubicO group peptidase (beta-lactamase class C family) [Herbihabitans rhizosphaerae]|uniref:CubicO group peptidase (Beta-lactamase class C family) n=1 Tax=Herbihabitans rhizosphaerae TaxID=1872711 RepID=A0A4Q7KWK4_9PSEU|nr:serine hydrolase domain-containing protein [Herbihabitans rhizosphaerae]RZS41075.1 CubicO group peptidase (beta-lactamase class C family) [Herbihabitans rhizosphaerae]
MRSVAEVRKWPVDNVAVAVVAADGTVLGAEGDQDRRYRLASVTKPLTAYAVLVAVEEGAVEWDAPAGPEGSTVRHLIAHTSGLAFDSRTVQAPPGERRIYSNAGFDVLAETVAAASEIPFADYLAEAVFTPLDMTSSALDGSAGAGAVSSCADLARFAVELQRPTLVSPRTLAEATVVAYPGLNGVLPGYGSQRPNDWGLGFEIRDGKSPHWTGANSSPETFGHFGQSGTFLWVDPRAGVACVALADRNFGEWAIEAWPAFTDAVLAELS